MDGNWCIAHLLRPMRMGCGLRNWFGAWELGEATGALVLACDGSPVPIACATKRCYRPYETQLSSNGTHLAFWVIRTTPKTLALVRTGFGSS